MLWDPDCLAKPHCYMSWWMSTALGAFPMAKQLLRLLRWYPPLQESWGLEMGLLRGIWFPVWEALRGQEGDLGRKQRRQGGMLSRLKVSFCCEGSNEKR